MGRQKKIGGQQEIAEAALALIDEQGLGSLTMRRVGAKLGVEAMTLYGYVKNREELLSVVHDLLMSKVEAPPRSDDWVVDALCFAREFRRVLMLHSNAVAIVSTRPATEGPALDLLEAALGRIPKEEHGPNEDAHIVQTLFSFVVGHCSFHAALAASPAEAALDPARHPRLMSLKPWSAEAEFEHGLEVLAAGLRARLQR